MVVSKARKPRRDAIIVRHARHRIVIRASFVRSRVPRCEISLCGCAPFISDALRRALVQGVSRALEPCYGHRIGVPAPDIQQLAVLARLVRVQQAKVLIETLVDRRSGRAADGHEQEKAQHQQRAPSETRVVRYSACYASRARLGSIAKHDFVGVDIGWNVSYSTIPPQQSSSVERENMQTECGGNLFPAMAPATRDTR